MQYGCETRCAPYTYTVYQINFDFFKASSNRFINHAVSIARSVKALQPLQVLLLLLAAVHKMQQRHLAVEHLQQDYRPFKKAIETLGFLFNF